MSAAVKAKNASVTFSLCMFSGVPVTVLCFVTTKPGASFYWHFYLDEITAAHVVLHSIFRPSFGALDHYDTNLASRLLAPSYLDSDAYPIDALHKAEYSSAVQAGSGLSLK
jgi:hypothetical protein